MVSTNIPHGLLPEQPFLFLYHAQVPVPLAWRPGDVFRYRRDPGRDRDSNPLTVTGNGIVRRAAIVSPVSRDLRDGAISLTEQWPHLQRVIGL